MIGYIYIITNEITNKQYIGQTINTIKERYNHHIHEAKYYKDTMYIHEAMRKYGFENFKVSELKCIESDNRKDLTDKLNYWEEFYILKYNTLKPFGYNLTIGGSGCKEVARVKIDEYDLYGNYITTHNTLIDAARSVGSNHNGAIHKCCIGKSKFAFQRIWRHHGDPLDKYELPDINIANREYKLAPVDQYSINGDFIKSYSSVIDAYKSLKLDGDSSHISDCCQHKLHTAYGYIWRYKDEPFGKIRDGRNVLIEQYDKDGHYIQTFSSIKEFCKSIGKNHKDCYANINRVCKGERKSAYGYIWKYPNK